MISPMNDIIEECRRLRRNLIPISTKYAGMLDETKSKNTLYPFVLLLGNHSSGKSSFINHLLKRKVQMTGVAPTDDNFTLIGPGDEDIDRNGPALIGDPDLGFSDLKMFGPVLVNHTQLKVRSDIAIKDFMIVDSPGMIDSPVAINQQQRNTTAAVGMDRGYNFEAVVRWYAERADVILLFFDPDKPGTTGETLSILTTSLVGLDHKMHIILNKADQFRKIHDFARAYGSLCWNLSKVIPRKDLPRIHTMCLPAKALRAAADPATAGEGNGGVSTAAAATATALDDSRKATDNNSKQSHSPSTTNNESSTAGDGMSGGGGGGGGTCLPIQTSPSVQVEGTGAMVAAKSFFDQGIHDLEESRADVIRETLYAPKRRIDNEISRLSESVSALLMHCTILDRAVAMYRSRLWRGRALIFTVSALSVGLTIGAGYLCDYLLQDGPPSAPTGGGSSSAHSSKTSSNSSSGGGANAGSRGSSSRATGSSATSSSRSSAGHLRGGSSNAAGSSGGTNNNSASSISSPAEGIIPAAQVAVVTQYHEFWKLQTKRSVVAWSGLVGFVSTAVTALWQHWALDNFLATFKTPQAGTAIYQDLYSKQLTSGDAFTISLGSHVLREFVRSVTPEALSSNKLGRVSAADFTALGRILNQDIANLRRRASPSFPAAFATTFGKNSHPNGSNATNGRELFISRSNSRSTVNSESNDHNGSNSIAAGNNTHTATSTTSSSSNLDINTSANVAAASLSITPQEAKQFFYNCGEEDDGDKPLAMETRNSSVARTNSSSSILPSATAGLTALEKQKQKQDYDNTVRRGNAVSTCIGTPLTIKANQLSSNEPSSNPSTQSPTIGTNANATVDTSNEIYQQ
mmetsp:Transcript_13428/g.22405  ORF Transcript_13428/g.22405 Transcript_13428/m.22405 type:complete len:859 (-) Transcript_13428:99-2675(-)